MNLCKNCSKEHKNNKFCSHSCSAIYTNKKRYPGKDCPNCNKKISQSRIYCSNICLNKYNHKLALFRWKNNEKVGVDTLKKYLINLYGYKCSECEISEWNNKPITLELEHKDGHSENDQEDNICLLCPNCHSQSPTYRAKNKGNGRKRRMIKYHELSSTGA